MTARDPRAGCMGIAMLALTVLLGTGVAAPAMAQHAPDAMQQGMRQVQRDMQRDNVRRQPPGTPGKVTAREDIVQGSGKGMAMLFWLFALGTIGGAVFVITRRNLIAAVMGMVATFFAVAAIYMMLYAHFLSVVQMLVYAGAIMVLFVFVIMILNRPEDEPWVEKRALLGKIVALGAMGYLLLRLVAVLYSVVPADKVGAAQAPRPVLFNGDVYDWGSTAAVGKELFTRGLFPFEAISILLLIAVVGAIAIARPLKNDALEAPGGAQR